jgi:hypothetical protein
MKMQESTYFLIFLFWTTNELFSLTSYPAKRSDSLQTLTAAKPYYRDVCSLQDPKILKESSKSVTKGKLPDVEKGWANCFNVKQFLKLEFRTNVFGAIKLHVWLYFTFIMDKWKLSFAAAQHNMSVAMSIWFYLERVDTISCADASSLNAAVTRIFSSQLSVMRTKFQTELTCQLRMFIMERIASWVGVAKRCLTLG